MRSKVTRWGLSAVTMASVATAVLFATGWQSAIAAQVTSVFVTNKAGSPVPVKGTVTISGTPFVNAANLHNDTNGNLRVAQQGTLTVHANNTDANGNLKVAEQGTPNVNVTNTDANGNLKVHEQGTANVNVQNPPTSELIQAGNPPPALEPGQSATFFDGSVNAYSKVTLSINVLAENGVPDQTGTLGLHCDVYASGIGFPIDSFDLAPLSSQQPVASVYKTYDSAMTHLTLYCTNPNSASTSGYEGYTIFWQLVGRTG